MSLCVFVCPEVLMYRLNPRRSIHGVALFVALVSFTTPASGNEKSMGQAVVSADTQKAFVEASSSSNLVALLKEGEAVSIILRISTSGEDWCRLVLPGHGVRAVQSLEFHFLGKANNGNWSH
jgi:hypothetical protein